MFGMIPFGREENSLFNYLDNMERSLFTGFGDMSSSAATFRTRAIPT